MSSKVPAERFHQIWGRDKCCRDLIHDVGSPGTGPLGGCLPDAKTTAPLLADAGLQGGAIYCSSDKHAAFPKSNPVSPGDLAATIFHALGIDHSTRVYNQAGQPHHLALGQLITDIFS